MKPKKVSLLISTYNSPDYLRLSLKSVLFQTRLPDEIVIADDGSGESTRDVIESFRAISRVPVKHIWHPDEGFRLAAIRNKAIAEISGDYIIQIDGDIILHPEFIADHMRFCRKGYFAGGTRAFINQTYSSIILKSKKFTYPGLRQHLGKSRKAFRSPIISIALCRILHMDPYKTGGCNMAYWKSDAISINGYNEDMTGWGCEDSEFAIRLHNSGVKKLTIRYSAIEFHIEHPDNSRSKYSDNSDMVSKAITQKLTYIPNGIVKARNHQ